MKIETKIKLRNRINKRVNELKDQGIVGMTLRDKSYQIKTEEEKRVRSEQNYTKANRKSKELIRDTAQKSGAINRFEKIQRRSQLYMLIETKQQLVRIANRVNMFEMIFENLKKFEINQRFPCELIEGNKAWISQSQKTKKYRYYTMEAGGQVFGLSIFDLIEIVDGVRGFQYATEELARLLDLDDLKDEWVETQKVKYEGNLDFLEHEARIRKRYPTLYRYIQGHLDLLKNLNHYGQDHVNRLFVHQEQDFFFVSTTFLAEKINPSNIKREQPKVSRAINLLALLGLIKKIPHPELPKDVLYNAIKQKGNNSKYKLVSFYKVPSYKNSEVMRNAEAMAKSLEKLGIHDSRGVSKANVLEYFGEGKLNEIYIPNFKIKGEAYNTQDDEINEPYPGEDEIPF